MKPVFLFLAVVILIHADAVAQGNKKPRITGQVALSTNEEESLTIQMSYLQVSDPDDWFYPWGFTMQVYPGNNYTVAGHVVTPVMNFNGKLLVEVTVNDGQAESNRFKLEIIVNPVNDKPVISGHSNLETNEGQALAIRLEDLKVTDPDNNYPQNFTLKVFNGNGYTVSDNRITPQAGFAGDLSVNVSVNDGQLDSDVYALPVAVKPVVRIPLIIGQATLRVDEDESLTILLSHLSVTDEDSNYPNGFSLNVGAGENYTHSGATITPANDFNGRLSVPVTVNDGQNTSKPFNVVITVTPVNDLPVLTDVESEPAYYNATTTTLPVTQSLVVKEVDGDSIMYAEVRVQSDTYQADIDRLVYTGPEGNIRAVFDTNTGVLTLLGQAAPQRYAEAIRDVHYECLMPSRNLTKTVVFTVNDGKANSEQAARQIVFGEVSVSLDIPTGFTPNGDQANDTWKIIPLKVEEAYSEARIRVYNKEGIMVYESVGFENEWDGRYNGELLPADTYFYTIDLNINVPEGYLKGLVTILR